MMENIFHIPNISMLNQLLNQEKSKHPLISIVDFSKVDFSEQKELINVKVTTDFYSILLKTLNTGSLKYGRNHYDFQEGSLFFMSPNQVVTVEDPEASGSIYGWGLYFHPDLIRSTSLDKKIKKYSFFRYDVNETLHLSEEEKEILSDIVNGLKKEIARPIDNHSKAVIVSGIELLLNHCMRYYDRQFITRTEANKDVVSHIEEFLTAYFNSEKPEKIGLPTVQQCAETVHLSPNYLSDLLKKETGKSTQDHIHYFLLEAAKSKLLSSNNSISEIAHAFGFDYPQYFSRLFKQKVGMTPLEYRNLN